MTDLPSTDRKSVSRSIVSHIRLITANQQPFGEDETNSYFRAANVP